MAETSSSDHIQAGGIAQFLEGRLARLNVELAERVSAEIEAAALESGYKSRRMAHEELNQILRRLRLCVSTEEVAAWLVDSTSSFSARAALFEVASGALRGVRARGFQREPSTFERWEIPLDRVPALAHCVRERDTVVAIGSPAEVSSELIAALGHAPDEKIYLYPLVIEEETVALLYAIAGGAPGRQFVDGAALELLTHAAAAAAQILSAAAARSGRGSSELVRIEPVKDVPRAADVDGVLLKAREARARWKARAAVSGLRLSKRAAVEQGRMERDIYSALKPEIDAARRAYRQEFLAVSPAIADHLHKELLNLAHDDPSLLGPDYPGCMS